MPYGLWHARRVRSHGREQPLELPRMHAGMMAAERMLTDAVPVGRTAHVDAG